jgi:hypothetical protein
MPGLIRAASSVVRLFTISRTSTNLVIEKTVAYDTSEGRFGGEIASIVAFGMASVG